MPGRPHVGTAQVLAISAPTRVVPAPHARCTQQPLQFNVRIVLNTSFKFLSLMNILTCKTKLIKLKNQLSAVPS